MTFPRILLRREILRIGADLEKIVNQLRLGGDCPLKGAISLDYIKFRNE